MSRVYNFSAGPAAMPLPVLKEIQSEMLEYGTSGMSVMEMSHRSKDFEEILHGTEDTLRDIMHIPANYKVLFVQGGGSQQFAAVPLNLMKNRVADYINTGAWTKKAIKEAQIYGKVNVIASSEDESFTYIPDLDNLNISEKADYVYICQNNTIYGTRYSRLPDTKGKVLVADVSSMFVSEPIDVEKYGVIYAGIQKNAGPSGLVVVIVREDLLTDEVLPETPTMLKWKVQADNDSMYNTPNTWGIYVCGKVFKWIKDMGGLEAMKQMNEKKASLLYDYLDNSSLFKGTVRKDSRSLMNVPFITGNADIDREFIAACADAGIKNIKGHRSVGGMRASIYNAVTYEAVQALVDTMEKFEREHA